MESFTQCGNSICCGNGATSKWVPILFCVAAAVAKYFALTLHYCTIAAAVQCEHFQWQHNKKHKKIAATVALCEWTLNHRGLCIL